MSILLKISKLSAKKSSFEQYFPEDSISTKDSRIQSLEEEIESFPESLYDNVEDFLNAEGLFIETGNSPSFTSTILKPFLNLKLLSPFTMKSLSNSGVSTPRAGDEEFQMKALPKFLVRRAFSAEQ